MEKEFYKNLKLFLKDIVLVFPEDDEAIQFISTSINLAILDDDELLIVKKFNKSLTPLENMILSRDNNIFLTDPANYWSVSSHEYNLFVKLNDNWSNFSDHNKNILWDYIQLLYILSKKILYSV
jgi:hypothetical protein